MPGHITPQIDDMLALLLLLLLMSSEVVPYFCATGIEYLGAPMQSLSDRELWYW